MKGLFVQWERGNEDILIKSGSTTITFYDHDDC